MWQAIERTRTILQMVVALSTIAGLVSVWLRFSVPGWLTLLLMALCAVGGVLLGARASLSRAPKREVRPVFALNRIAFNYFDDPQKHGWRVTHDSDEKAASLRFEVVNDATVGRCAAIEAGSGVRVEYSLGEADYIADAFELDYIPGRGSGFYIRLRVAQSGPDDHYWINYRIGRDDPRHLNHKEWVISVQPVPMPGKWMRLRRDIREDFAKTFAQDGLGLDQVSAVRIRGSMNVASMTLMSSTEFSNAPR